MMEIVGVVQGIDYLERNLRRFTRPARRRTALHTRSGTNRVEYQPLGVVGVISPWNYPVNLSLMPVVTAIAAGNRVMLKPSKFVPATNAVLASMLAPTVVLGVTDGMRIAHEEIFGPVLPIFGGVGESGMGKYHGIEGFRTPSHPKVIYVQGRWNSIRPLRQARRRPAQLLPSTTGGLHGKARARPRFSKRWIGPVGSSRSTV